MHDCKREDVLSGAALHAGRWKRLFEREASAAHAWRFSNASATWAESCGIAAQWLWAPATCSLPALPDPERLCREDRPLVLVGDSLTRGLFVGLVTALHSTAAGPCSLGASPDWPGTFDEVDRSTATVMQLRCTAGPCSKTTVLWVRNDFLCPVCSGAHTRYPYEFSRPQVGLAKLARWVAAKWPDKSAVVMLATGTWWSWSLRDMPTARNGTNPRLPLPEVEALFRSTVEDAFRVVVKVARQVIHRMDFPGHLDDCLEVARRPLAVSPHLHGTPQPYERQQIYVLNRFTAATCQRHAACDTLDVSHLSSLRPDAHRIYKNDCVHWCTRGEPVYSWVLLLAAMLS